MSILYLAGLLIFALIVHSNLNGIRKDIRDLKKRLNELQGGPLPNPAVQAIPPVPVFQAPMPAPAKPEKLEEFEDFDTVGENAVLSPTTLREKNTAFEFKIGAKLPVWIGAFCLICAGFFLVKYSIEVGFLTPAVRTFFAGIFGVALLAAGKYVAFRGAANAERISQGLIGAGIVLLYFTFYAAVNLYHLLPQAAGFAGMVAVTVTAVILSLRHGQAISIFGLVGGLLTPALISAETPSAASLFGYLTLFGAGSIFMMAKQGWWKLALATVIGLFFWVGIWGMNYSLVPDRHIIILFAMGIMAAVTAVTGMFHPQEGEARDTANTMQFVSMIGAFLTLVALAAKVSLSLFDWGMIGILSAACIALAYKREEIYARATLVKLGADLVLFLFWARHAEMMDIYLVGAGIFAVFTIAPLYLMMTRQDIKLWASLQSVAAVGAYLICYMAEKAHGSLNETAYAIIAVLLAGLFALQTVRMRKDRGDHHHIDWVSAVYSLAIGAFVSLAMIFTLKFTYLPMVFALETLVTVYLVMKYRFAFLETVGLVLCAVFVFSNYEQVVLFAQLTVNAISDVKPSLDVERFRIPSLALMLGIPAAIFSLASIFALREMEASKLMRVIFMMACGLLLATLYYPVRQAFDGAGFLTENAGFAARAGVTTIFVVMGIGLLRLLPEQQFSFYRTFALVLLNIGFARIFFCDLFLDNPYWSSKEQVGALPLLNGVTYLYGLGALAMAYSLYRVREIAGKQELQNIYKAGTLVLIFSFTSLTVRQLFHGSNLHDGSVGNAEMYSYSIVWLLTSIALLTLGMKRNNRPVRIAAMGFMALTIAKVFLIDAGELTGLYRIFSFFGLGVCLIGLSYFYTKFVAKQGEEKI